MTRIILQATTQIIEEIEEITIVVASEEAEVIEAEVDNREITGGEDTITTGEHCQELLCLENYLHLILASSQGIRISLSKLKLLDRCMEGHHNSRSNLIILKIC